jgi:hypothetical protein
LRLIGEKLVEKDMSMSISLPQSILAHDGHNAALSFCGCLNDEESAEMMSSFSYSPPFPIQALPSPPMIDNILPHQHKGLEQLEQNHLLHTSSCDDGSAIADNNRPLEVGLKKHTTVAEQFRLRRESIHHLATNRTIADIARSSEHSSLHTRPNTDWLPGGASNSNVETTTTTRTKKSEKKHGKNNAERIKRNLIQQQMSCELLTYQERSKAQSLNEWLEQLHHHNAADPQSQQQQLQQQQQQHRFENLDHHSSISSNGLLRRMEPGNAIDQQQTNFWIQQQQQQQQFELWDQDDQQRQQHKYQHPRFPTTADSRRYDQEVTIHNQLINHSFHWMRCQNFHHRGYYPIISADRVKIATKEVLYEN